ncbi:MAG: SEC-C domain-containing protein [Candidatus Sericytochromatia bacterium]|nr:SEC-C domain-containing protein [Candidatus Tanganyikabacteria bacterium]
MGAPCGFPGAITRTVRRSPSLVRKRGQELQAAAAVRPGAPAPGYLAAPSARKAPCPCGSGKRFKHCRVMPSQEAAQRSKAPPCSRACSKEIRHPPHG